MTNAGVPDHLGALSHMRINLGSSHTARKVPSWSSAETRLDCRPLHPSSLLSEHYGCFARSLNLLWYSGGSRPGHKVSGPLSFPSCSVHNVSDPFLLLFTIRSIANRVKNILLSFYIGFFTPRMFHAKIFALVITLILLYC